MKEKSKKVFVAFISIVLFLILFEIALRFLFISNHNKIMQKYLGRDLCEASDKNLIFTYKPNTCGFNNNGYRDTNHEYHKKQNVFRIILIGDSVAESDWVDINQSMGKLIERYLTTQTAKKFEVILLGRSGYGTAQELILLENEAAQYEPDLILWSYVLNDAAHPVYHNPNGEAGRYFYRPTIHVFNFFRERLFFLKERINGGSCSKDYHEWLPCVYWNQITLHIPKIGEFAKERERERSQSSFLFIPFLQCDLFTHTRMKNCMKN